MKRLNRSEFKPERNRPASTYGLISPNKVDKSMSRLTNSLLALALVFVTSPDVYAADFTGKEAFIGCLQLLSGIEDSSTQGNYSDGLSAGYCLGMMEGARFASDITDTLRVGKLICVPAYIDDIEMVEKTTLYLLSSPDLIKDSATSTLLAALSKRYPCN
jgi:hypothetical protein